MRVSSTENSAVRSVRWMIHAIMAVAPPMLTMSGCDGAGDDDFDQASEPREGISGLSDIQGHWGRDAIASLHEQGLVSGYADGTFRPGNALTRAELAALLSRAFAEGPRDCSAPTFSDVPPSHWAYGAIRTAARKCFVSGYKDGTFKPSAPIKRGEALVAIAAGLGLSGEQSVLGAFSDIQEVPLWMRPALAAAVGAGILPNEHPTRRLAVDTNINRGEAAVALWFALRAWNEYALATVEHVEGNGELKRVGLTVYQRATPGVALYDGDLLRSQGELVIECKDGTEWAIPDDGVPAGVSNTCSP